MADTLNVKETLFVEYYIATGHKMNSAIAAGYSETSAHVTASRMLKKAKILKAIREKLAILSEEIKVDAEYVKVQATILHRQATKQAPVIDYRGNEVDTPFDATTARTALKLIGEHKSVKAFETVVKHVGDEDRPIGVSLNSTDRAARVADLMRQALVAHDKNKGKK